MRNPGKIYKIKNKQYAVAYDKLQIPKYLEAGKLLVKMFGDLELKEPILNENGKQLNKIISPAGLKIVGFLE
jgi:hypothetical protein